MPPGISLSRSVSFVADRSPQTYFLCDVTPSTNAPPIDDGLDTLPDALIGPCLRRWYSRFARRDRYSCAPYGALGDPCLRRSTPRWHSTRQVFSRALRRWHSRFARSLGSRRRRFAPRLAPRLAQLTRRPDPASQLGHLPLRRILPQAPQQLAQHLTRDPALSALVKEGKRLAVFVLF